MGYSTDFFGSFEITPALSAADREFLTKLANTRRMKRNVGPEYGVEGEFYVDGAGFMGQDRDASVIEDAPPSTQPGLWCKWVPNEAGTELEWNGAEKFYEYVAWVEYLIAKILAPRGYTLNGTVEWQGEDREDIGKIIVEDNAVHTVAGQICFPGE